VDALISVLDRHPAPGADGRRRRSARVLPRPGTWPA